ncbi:MAG: hypothetical protein FWE16_00950 [Firmicutes bacterium]|nr:hypothetical protein [Bacillota bacterium]
MKKKLLIVIPIIVVIVCMAILSSVMFLGWGRSNATADDFSLTISVRETTVQAGDRIYIDISLKNHTWRAQRISHFDLFYPYISDVFNASGFGYITTTGPSIVSRIRRHGEFESGWWKLPLRFTIPIDAKIGAHDLLVKTWFWIENQEIKIVSNLITITII